MIVVNKAASPIKVKTKTAPEMRPFSFFVYSVLLLKVGKSVSERSDTGTERNYVKRVKQSRMAAIWIRAALLDGGPS
jgi:hypothetical protein